ncbi:DUF389 domain-containing protein [soil metagenome]
MQARLGMSYDDIRRIEAALFFEPPMMRQRLIRFAVLIILSSIIATGGLLSNSVATIIGAMIIAPLMTPIMGIVVALILGSRSRATKSAIIVTLGVGLAIVVGWIMANLMPGGWNPASSAQVIDRTSPGLLTLIIALASGAAGAYALSRSDVADSLPGVAIAISLVPPLNNVGILLAERERDLAAGSALLFVTNFAAILLAGTVTFFLTGLAEGVHREPREMRRSLLAICVLICLVAIPLVANTEVFWRNVNREDAAIGIVNEWLADSDWEVYQVSVDGNKVEVLVGGEGELPDSNDALMELEEVMNGSMELSVRILGVRKEVITT